MTWIRRYSTKKSLFPKFQLIPILHFQVMHDVCFTAPTDDPYCVDLSLVDKTFCENCSHFILKWLQPNSFGEMCFLESYEKMHKIQILKILRAPSIWNQGVCLHVRFSQTETKSSTWPVEGDGCYSNIEFCVSMMTAFKCLKRGCQSFFPAAAILWEHAFCVYMCWSLRTLLGTSAAHTQFFSQASTW